MKNRWREKCGYRDILKLAFPLILSTGSMTIQHVIDRMFLTWHSPEAIAAAMPAGMISFTFMALFIGTASYVNTFVAQYSGAKEDSRIGPVVWQGFYFSLLTGFLILLLYPLAPKIFAMAGHASEVQRLEIIYFRIMILGGFAVTASSGLSGFFSGRGRTRVIMWVTFAATAINIVLDYLLIFGKCGLPAMGIRGAAVATIISQYARLGIYLVLVTRPTYRERYQTLAGWRPDKALFSRLMKFGFPNGLHFFLEMTGFTLLILIMGRFGTIPLAATNITFNINHLAFMPMVGFGMAVSILVGKRLGEDRPELAKKATWSAFHMTTIYIIGFALCYLLIPRLFLLPYASKADPVQFPQIASLTVRFMKFVAFYCLFDNMNIIFAAAVKGAGDTRFVMWTSVLLSWSLMVIPSYISIVIFSGNIFMAWGFAALYIFVLGNVFLLRFLNGKWMSMRVIEKTGLVSYAAE